MTAALAERWRATNPSVPIDFSEASTFVYETISAKELLYDAPRGRYFACNLDPDTMTRTGEPEDWTDSVALPTGLPAGLGVPAGGVGPSDVPVEDFAATLSGSTYSLTAKTRYLPFPGVVAQQTIAGDVRKYLDDDLVGSTQLTTDAAGDAATVYAYTAFGEAFWVDGSGVARIGGLPPSSDTRYLYCGQWGYESGLLTLVGVNSTLPTMALQHVGYRWYEPGIGRFVQRDPDGVKGGINVYAYAENSPTHGIDPLGLEGDFSLGGVMASAGVGAVLGGISNGMSSGSWSWADAGLGAIAGGVGGGVGFFNALAGSAAANLLRGLFAGDSWLGILAETGAGALGGWFVGRAAAAGRSIEGGLIGIDSDLCTNALRSALGGF